MFPYIKKLKGKSKPPKIYYDGKRDTREGTGVTAGLPSRYLVLRLVGPAGEGEEGGLREWHWIMHMAACEQTAGGLPYDGEPGSAPCGRQSSGTGQWAGGAHGGGAYAFPRPMHIAERGRSHAT